MSEGRQTVAGAYAKMDAHEAVCAERYDGINSQLKSLFGWVKMGVVAIITVLFMVAVGSLVELYRVQISKLPQAPTQSVVVQQPAPAAKP